MRENRLPAAPHWLTASTRGDPFNQSLQACVFVSLVQAWLPREAAKLQRERERASSSWEILTSDASLTAACAAFASENHRSRDAVPMRALG
jgi:hypothetical protein